jgi:hypothetical protein
MHRLASVLVIAVLVACSKKDADSKKEPAVGGSAAAAAATTTVPEAPTKPPPPPESFKGDNRVVNLLLDESGKPMTIDIWGKRSFEYGPIQFAKDVAYGQASAYFGIPTGTSTIAVPAGAGDRAKEVGSLFAAKDGEEITTVMFREDNQPKSIVMGMKPVDLHNAPAAPPAGKGTIYIYAGPLRGIEAKLTEKYGGSAFYVGDGSTTCLRQRLEDQGKQAAILGGTNSTTHDVAPGKAKVTLHKWEPGKNCTTPAVHELEVEVADGKGTFVVLHSPDNGSTIAAVQIPMWK